MKIKRVNQIWYCPALSVKAGSLEELFHLMEAAA